MNKNLDFVFNPNTIAVVGASNEKNSVGYDLFANLERSKFKGRAYPVNNKRKKIQGKEAFKSIKDIPGKIDLAIIAVPAKIVPSVIEECGLKGVKGAVIISAGFNEIGGEGRKLQERIGETGKKYGMRIIGPNCLGFMRPEINLNASFASHLALPGKIGLISQSGALCTAILDWSAINNIGFSNFISIGSMVDVDFNDLIEYLGNDKKTESILIYMESLKNAPKFIEIAKRVSIKKPIFVLKTGRCHEGAKAAQSHTGSLTGNDQVFSAAFEKAGIKRIDAIEDLFNIAKGISMQPRPKGKNLAIITNAGGVGVIASDSLIFSGGKLAKISKNTIEKLNKILPSNWSRNNPIDILGDATPDRYKKTIEFCANEKNIDGILVILTPQAMTDPTEVSKELIKISKKIIKPIMAVWMGGKDVEKGIKILQKNNIPNFSDPESAIRFFILTQEYNSRKKGKQSPEFIIDKSANEKILKEAKTSGAINLNEYEAKQFLANYSLPVAKGRQVKTIDEAINFSKELSFPVVMKILSNKILHKVDKGGVELNISSEEKVKSIFSKLISITGENSVYMEKQITGRYEILLGCKNDEMFGPVIVFGTGGTAVEIYRDIKMDLTPLDKEDIDGLIKKTKIYKLLRGYRNLPPVNIEKLNEIIYRFSKLADDFKDIIKEIDINPLMADENGFTILDAKIILK